MLPGTFNFGPFSGLKRRRMFKTYAVFGGQISAENGIPLEQQASVLPAASGTSLFKTEYWTHRGGGKKDIGPVGVGVKNILDPSGWG